MPLLYDEGQPTAPKNSKPAKPKKKTRAKTQPSYSDALTTAEIAAAEAAASAANAGEIAELDAIISRLRLAQQEGQGATTRQLQDLNVESTEARTDARRNTAQARAQTLRGFAGRGLALSGVRAGAESRLGESLIRAVGAINRRQNAGRDALREALESLNRKTAIETNAARRKREALL